ncbi:MAG TPA: hypothetical protein VMH28_17845 [Candidatus Acidoferrales bacterium]|nr:hypothetical protein [Candidatus Acidoferrales bacterium]
MRRVGRSAAGLLLLASSGAGQIVVNPGRMRNRIEIFNPKPGETALRCEVTPIHPALNFSFRYQAGYRVTMPANQFTGAGHRLMVLVRITPKEGAGPVYLAAMQRLPEIPNTSVQLRFGGGYLLGEGAYQVDWVVLDERDRVFRKSWHVEVRRSHAERNVKVAMDPGTVLDVSLRGARLVPKESDSATLRLTILLNAAPISTRRTHLGPNDIGTLLSAVSSLLERVPLRQVRLVAFNLEQQKELYRNDNFMLAAMPAVARAMNTVELETVDYQVLKNRSGHVDLLANLINQEINGNPAADIVLFLGPVSRYEDRLPAELLARNPERVPRFLNIEILPFLLAPSTVPDVIHNATARLGGKSLLIHTPGEFASALERLK